MLWCLGVSRRHHMYLCTVLSHLISPYLTKTQRQRGCVPTGIMESKRNRHFQYLSAGVSHSDPVIWWDYKGGNLRCAQALNKSLKLGTILMISANINCSSFLLLYAMSVATTTINAHIHTFPRVQWCPLVQPQSLLPTWWRTQPSGWQMDWSQEGSSMPCGKRASVLAPYVWNG